jgi:putative glycerol-1-phosphate prenyltransferase
LFVRNHKKKIILIDPDKWKLEDIDMISNYINNNENIAFVFLGGSIIKNFNFHKFLSNFKMKINKPIISFCGGSYQISEQFDAFLIPFPLNTYDYNYFWTEILKNAILLSQKYIYIFGYLLLSSKWTSSFIISKAYEISENEDIILSFVKVCEIMKFSAIYLESGSGGKNYINFEILSKIRKWTNLPLIVGGGIRDIQTIEKIFEFGADYVVIGNYIEENPKFISEL